MEIMIGGTETRAPDEARKIERPLQVRLSAPISLVKAIRIFGMNVRRLPAIPEEF